MTLQAPREEPDDLFSFFISEEEAHTRGMMPFAGPYYLQSHIYGLEHERMLRTVLKDFEVSKRPFALVHCHRNKDRTGSFTEVYAGRAGTLSHEEKARRFIVEQTNVEPQP